MAQYDKGGGGARDWARDTSGSTQVVGLMDGKLVIGGHFYAVGDQGGDRCGAGRPGDVDQKGDPILNPFGECKSRQGIAAYSFGGQLDPNWHPAYSGSYSLVWALHVEGDRLHTGGEFKKVSGVTQTSYARLSPASRRGRGSCPEGSGSSPSLTSWLPSVQTLRWEIHAGHVMALLG